MRKGALIPLFLLAIFIFSSLVNAQPPFTQTGTFTEGYEIKIPPIFFLKQNQDFTFNFHVYNISNGMPISNSSTECFFHLYSSNGTQVLETALDYSPGLTVLNEWEITVKGSNFSEIGIYGYIVQCNSTNLGGFESIELEVNKLGREESISESLIYGLLTFAVFLFFAISLYFAVILPYSNEINEKGAVIKITKLKYAKIFMITLTYLLFVWFLNVLIAVSDNLVSLTLYYGFISFLFDRLINLSIPFIVFMIVLAFFEIIRDSNLSKNLKELGSAMR